MNRALVLVLSGFGIVSQTLLPLARALALNSARSSIVQVSNLCLLATFDPVPDDTYFLRDLFLPKNISFQC